MEREARVSELERTKWLRANWEEYPFNLFAAIENGRPHIVFPRELTEKIEKGIVLAMSHLPERTQEMLLMRYKEGLTYAKISEKFDVKKERVRQIICLGIRELAKPQFVQMMRAVEETKRHTINDIEIDDMKLSVRTDNVIRRAGNRTVNDLLKYKDKDSIMKIKGMTIKGAKEIAKKLYELKCINDVWEAWLE